MKPTVCGSLGRKNNLKKIRSLTPHFPALFLFDPSVSDIHKIANWARVQLSEWPSIVSHVRVEHCVTWLALNASDQHTTLTSWRSTFFAWLISRKQRNDSSIIEREDAQVFILFTFPGYPLLPIDICEFHAKQGVRIRNTERVCCRHVQNVVKRERMIFLWAEK